MFPCPSCKCPLDPQIPYCRFCSLAVRFEPTRAVPVYPVVQPGDVIMSHDLGSTVPHEMKKEDFTLSNGCVGKRSAEGLYLEVPAGQAYECGFGFARRRDGCVRASFVAWDPSVVFQLVMRRENLGEAKMQYGFSIWPARSQVRLVRSVSSVATTVAIPLLDWQAAPTLLPVGQMNDVEFRVFGCTLEGCIRGQRVIVFHDPVLGIGMPAVRVEAVQTPGRCTWRGIEVRTLA